MWLYLLVSSALGKVQNKTWNKPYISGLLKTGHASSRITVLLIVGTAPENRTVCFWCFDKNGLVLLKSKEPTSLLTSLWLNGDIFRLSFKKKLPLLNTLNDKIVFHKCYVPVVGFPIGTYNQSINFYVTGWKTYVVLGLSH